MDMKNEKLDELIKLLGFDTGLASAARKAQVNATVEEIQTMIDRVRANRVETAKVLKNASQEFKDEVARLRVRFGI